MSIMEEEKRQKGGDSSLADIWDVADDQRNQFDLAFALKSWNPQPMFSRDSTKDIEQKIMGSPRLNDVVDQLVNEGHGDKQQILAEAEQILVEMGNTYKLSTIRFLGLFFAKLIRRLYKGLTINRSGVDKLREALAKGPVLLLPTHRSYADFILVSYLFFTLDLPLPVIAAGMDFKGMKLVSRILQNAGAFYIRRSFRQDVLYWNLVSEYVRHHIVNFQAPVEFFLEGTRSRVGKSLPPKSGLLSMALDPFLKGDVPDVQICTISISYERTLEENLYAYEVLGIPKPKETTTGFLAAIDKIRGENFGRIYVHVNEPISVRDHLNRRIPKWYLPSFRVDLDEEQQKEIHDLSHYLVCRQQSSAITPVFAIVSVLLSTGRFSFPQLQEYFIKLNSLVAAYGTPCLIQNDLQKILEESLLVHKNKIRYTDGKFYYHFDPATTSDLQARAAARLVLQQYTNQLLANLINLALVAYVQEKCNCTDSGDFVNETSFLANYLREEFLLVRPCEERDLVLLKSADPELVNPLRRLVQPYIEGLYVLLHIINSGFSTVKEINGNFKMVTGELVEMSATSYAEIMAIDKTQRHLHNLVKLGHLKRIKSSSNENAYQVVEVAGLIQHLDVFVDPEFRQAVEVCRQKLPLVKSKL